MPSASAPSRTPAHSRGSCSASQAYLVPVKYGSSRRPVSSATRSSTPSARSRSQMAVVRRSCQTIAGPGRVQGAPVPDDGGLALVGDPDAGRLLVGAGQRLAAGGDGRRPDVVGLVLDPAGAGEQLRELPVAAGQDVALLAHDQRGHPGRPCVDGQHWHGANLAAAYGGARAALLLRHRVHRGRHHHRPRLHRRRRRDRPRVLRGEHPVRPGQGDPVGAAQRARPAALAGGQGVAQPRADPRRPAGLPHRPRARRSSCGPGSAPTTTSRCASSGARCPRCPGRSRGSPASCGSAGTTSASRSCRPSRPARTTPWSTPATTSARWQAMEARPPMTATATGACRPQRPTRPAESARRCAPTSTSTARPWR